MTTKYFTNEKTQANFEKYLAKNWGILEENHGYDYSLSSLNEKVDEVAEFLKESLGDEDINTEYSEKSVDFLKNQDESSLIDLLEIELNSDGSDDRIFTFSYSDKIFYITKNL